MKSIKHLHAIAFVVLLSFVLSPFPATAAEKSRIDKLQAEFAPVFKKLPSAEIPAKADSLLDDAAATAKQDTAFAILRVIAGLNPSAVGLVVAALVENEPTLSQAISNEASRLLPQSNAEIQRAAGVGVAAAEAAKKKGHYKTPKPPKPPKP